MTAFVLVDADNQPVKWPATINDIRLQHPDISFPRELPESGFPELRIYPLRLTDTPAFNPAQQKVEERPPVFSGSYWQQQWEVVQLTPAEQQSATEHQATSVRADRNQRLAESDWTQLQDAPVDHAAWATYRQALRDVTAQPSFPWTVTWPVAPA